MKFLTVYKPRGMTPLEAIETVRQIKPELKDKKISYAGRLDPLAHGVLLLLIEEKIKQKDTYLSLSKTYEFEVLFGIKTDTYDILGYLEEIILKPVSKNVNIFVNNFVNSHIGQQMQSYPPYSSRTVQGKPLFWWAREGKLNEIEIPKHKIEIYHFKLIKTGKINQQKLEQKVKNEIPLVKGDFRQDVILNRWEELFSSIKNPNHTFLTMKFLIECSSGTYIRGLTQELGIQIGCGAIAIDIMRTKVGRSSIKNAITL